MAVKLKIADDFEDCEPLPLTNFPNGQVNHNTGNLIKITMMRKKGERNPRKRVLVGETDRLTYFGTNFETESGLYTPSYCKYLVGSLNKKTRVMTLHKADIYHMSPSIHGMNSETSTSEATPSKSKFSREDYTSTHDKMVQSFGSERAKKAWSAAKRNKIDSSVLDSTLLTALDYAEEEMKKANEEEPKRVVSQTSSFIPPFDINATTPEDVYNLTDIISDDVMSQLKTPAATIVRATPQDISKWRDKETRVEFVLSNIATLPKGSGAYKTASILLYCEYLIRMYCLSSREIERNGLTKLSYIPDSIKSQLLHDYTEQGPRSTGTTGILSKRMKDKILSSLLVLGLIINGYSFDTTVLQRDLKIQSTKILGVSKILGCSVATTEKTVKGQSKHYTVTLKVPLVFNVPTPRGGRKKRN